jgi:hypothetical protein
MNRVCEQSEAIVQIDDRIVIADDVEFERSASIHYGGLCGVFCYLVSTSIQVWHLPSAGLRLPLLSFPNT